MCTKEPTDRRFISLSARAVRHYVKSFGTPRPPQHALLSTHANSHRRCGWRAMRANRKVPFSQPACETSLKIKLCLYPTGARPCLLRREGPCVPTFAARKTCTLTHACAYTSGAQTSPELRKTPAPLAGHPLRSIDAKAVRRKAIHPSSLHLNVYSG